MSLRARLTRRAPRRIAACAAALAATASLGFATAAPASTGQSTVFDLGGFAFNVSPGKRTDLLDQSQTLGVDTVRILVFWRDFAPGPNSSSKPQFNATDPAAYPAANWGPLDDLVRGANDRGMNVLLTPSAPVPDWASSTQSSMFKDPSPEEFQKFVTALGTRYSGSYSPPPASILDPPQPALPRVHTWSVWNEPNITLFLQPQLKGGKSVSGKIYRRLFLAAQDGLKATGHGGDSVLIGETSPGPGRKGTDPITFMRGVFCLTRKFKPRGNCDPIKAAGWAQHPYDPFDPPFTTSRDLINVHSIGKLIRALKRAARAGATTNSLPIYVTEYGVESVPDRHFGVSQLRQAEFIGISEYLMYRNPRIRSFGQYLMQDDRGGSEFSFQTGLRFTSGAAKIAYEAFPITLAAQRKSMRDHSVRIWGHVRPADGPVSVAVTARKPGGTAKKIEQIQTNGEGYFSFNTPFRNGRRYQASASLPGQSLKGPFERVYVFR